MNNYILLTGDRKLRTVSAYDGVEVHGVIYIFDTLVEFNMISRQVAVEKLQQLFVIILGCPKRRLISELTCGK